VLENRLKAAGPYRGSIRRPGSGLRGRPGSVFGEMSLSLSLSLSIRRGQCGHYDGRGRIVRERHHRQ